MASSRKLPKSLQSWLIPILRRAAMRWPGKVLARDKAKVYVPDGYFKNGNPRTKLMFKCAKCLKFVDRDSGHMDHINPVVGVEGFSNWDNYINTLFCGPENFQHLCLVCHQQKTQIENKQRAHYKKKSNKKR